MANEDTFPILLSDGFAVRWSVINGDVDTSDEPFNLSDSLPFEEEQLDFNSKFTWDSVELKYTAIGDDYESLGRFKVRARIFAYRTATDPNGNETLVTRDIGYNLTSMTIYSEDPNSGNTWIFPDDYPEQGVDKKHPKQYGGVIMKNTLGPREMDTQFSECGLEGGPENDAIVPWRDSNNRQQEAISAYKYLDVFDDTEFSYIPMNSNVSVDLKDNESFRFTPLYPDVKDENGKAAPIYPMNTITSFKPDGRDTVTVKYKVKIEATFGKGSGNQYEGKTITLDNPIATIKQNCVQDVSDYAKQMENLFQYCNWNNPQGIQPEDFAPDYPILYPYTNINGHEGLGTASTPNTRGDDTDNAPLERGDVWFNPNSEQRTYYNISDIPERLEVEEGGNGYKDRKNVMCVWLPPQERCYKITDQSNIPFGLMCDIKTEKGQVVSAAISNTGSPSGWSDGDIVAVTGGKNNARLKISIKEEPGWTENYVEVF